jgi:hypothetical protein
MSMPRAAGALRRRSDRAMHSLGEPGNNRANAVCPQAVRQASPPVCPGAGPLSPPSPRGCRAAQTHARIVDTLDPRRWRAPGDGSGPGRGAIVKPLVPPGVTLGQSARPWCTGTSPAMGRGAADLVMPVSGEWEVARAEGRGPKKHAECGGHRPPGSGPTQGRHGSERHASTPTGDRARAVGRPGGRAPGPMSMARRVC